MFVVFVMAEVIFLNVIIVNDYSYINGGASAIAIETAIALAERGHKVIFFSAVAEDNDILKGNSLSHTYLSISDLRRLSGTDRI